jgi:hypothetical protein
LLNAQYNEMVSSSRLYPQVGGSYQFQIREEDQGAGRDRHTVERSYYNLTINQALWHWGSVRAAARVGDLGTLMAEHNIEGARRALVLEVRNAYLALILVGLRNATQAPSGGPCVAGGAKGGRSPTIAILDFGFALTRRTRHRPRRPDLVAVAPFAALGVRSFTRPTSRNQTPPADRRRPIGGSRSTKSEALLARAGIEQKLNVAINRKAWPKLSDRRRFRDDNLYSTLDRRM